MRILLVTNYQPPHIGGIEFAGESLKRCWIEAGHSVTWLTSDIPRGAKPSEPENVRVSASNILESWVQANCPLVSPFRYPQIAALVRQHDVVNVHSLAPGVSSWALLAAIRNRKPLVVTQHVGVIPLRSGAMTALQDCMIRRMAEWVTAHGALLTFVGESVKDWFLANASIPPRQVFMTPAGIDRNVFTFVTDDERVGYRQKWGLGEGRLGVLFVGRFYEKKGLPLLREVAGRLPHVQFTLVGGGPIDPGQWALPNVRVIGYVSNKELRQLYGAHDLFIMPSYGEGWPAVVPQAMVCGTRCLVSEETFGGYGRDRDMFLVCPRDCDAIVARLSQAGVALWARAGRAETALYAGNQWDWGKTAHVFVELFRKVTDAHVQTP